MADNDRWALELRANIKMALELILSSQRSERQIKALLMHIKDFNGNKDVPELKKNFQAQPGFHIHVEETRTHKRQREERNSDTTQLLPENRPEIQRPDR